MLRTPEQPLPGEVFSLKEIARAAALTAGAAGERLRLEGLPISGKYVPLAEAVRLVRVLSGRARAAGSDRPVVSLVPAPRRRTAGPLAVSGLIHAGLVAVLAMAATLGLLGSDATEARVPPPEAKLVFLVEIAPGGGGGGGGLQLPMPPSAAELEAPVKKISSPVPRPRRIPPPPRRPPYRPAPARPVRVQPQLAETPPPMPEPDVVVAPVVQVPADLRTNPGVLAAPPAPPSAGSGRDGGAGTGAGFGVGRGSGSGLGDGQGGGTGGGLFRPGSGITPPVLVREVRPQYTPEARRRGIEGEVQLEIVVREDGTVGRMRVIRSLDAGLDQRAMDAVRQWRFNPSRRQDAPVDVSVQVSVAFSLR